MNEIFITAKLDFFNPDPKHFNPKDGIEYRGTNDEDNFELEKLLSSEEDINKRIIKGIYEELNDNDLIDKTYNRLGQFIRAESDTNYFKLEYKKAGRYNRIFISLIEEEDE